MRSAGNGRRRAHGRGSAALAGQRVGLQRLHRRGGGGSRESSTPARVDSSGESYWRGDGRPGTGEAFYKIMGDWAVPLTRWEGLGRRVAEGASAGSALSCVECVILPARVVVTTGVACSGLF